MKSNKLAKRLAERLQAENLISEPLLIVDCQRYSTSQLKRMTQNGDLLRLDGVENSDQLSERECPRYWAAQSFVSCIEGGTEHILLCVWSDQDTAAPSIDVLAPVDWQVTISRVNWNVNSVSSAYEVA